MKIEFQNIPVPEELDQVVEKNLNQIYSRERRKKFRDGIVGIGVSAAVVVGGIFWGMHTPALAENTPRLLENIPILRGIFTSMQEDMCFSGDYDSIGEEVYMDSKTINGLTVTLAEVYCNDQALYISFTMESENVLPDTDILNCLTVYATGEFSYWEHAKLW